MKPIESDTGTIHDWVRCSQLQNNGRIVKFKQNRQNRKQYKPEITDVMLVERVHCGIKDCENCKGVDISTAIQPMRV